MTQNIIAFAQIIVSIVGGIGIAWYWNERSSKLAQYRYLDESYSKLLEAYLANPEFGDKLKVENYATEFRDAHALKYHCFALSVHTAMETIFDVYGPKIPREWRHIFDYHTNLHSKWLRANPAANEPGYIKQVCQGH
jgi:hypothetical protein